MNDFSCEEIQRFNKKKVLLLQFHKTLVKVTFLKNIQSYIFSFYLFVIVRKSISKSKVKRN